MEAFGGMFGLPQMHRGPFVEQFSCLSLSFADKADKENGDKILLPISAFTKLASMRVQYPMQFEIRNENVDPPRRTHVGVLEFTAPEGQMFVPYWIMQNLLLEENELVTVRNVSLSLANFVKFRPQSVDFLEISNPKVVLETALRNFSCLTKDDQICLHYNGKNYFIDIVELKPVTPENAVSIVEADVNVDFEPPVGYVDPQVAAAAQAKNTAAAAGSTDGSSSTSAPVDSLAELAKAREERLKQLEASKAKYVPFSGTGRRIDDKAVRQDDENGSSSATAAMPVAPQAGRQLGSKWKDKKKTQGSAFHGQGRSLG